MQKIIPVALLLLLPLAANATPCQFSAPRNVDIDAAGLKSLRVTLGSADMDIRSVPGLARIEVRGTACASDATWLKDLQVTSDHVGDQASVQARNNHDEMNFGMFGSSYAYLKLQVRVPAPLAIDVDSGSGDVQAANLASLDFNSGSGDLVATDIAGMLALKLGSADAKASRVGSVDLRQTGSGDVGVDGVKGDVHAGHSGSGDLAFSNVGGGVDIGATGSGDITLEHVGRDVKVGSTGSGDVDANDVGGNFTVSASGSGDIHHAGVKGKVSVPASDD